MGAASAPSLLIAASGTGGHLFPALAVAEALPNYRIAWLGVANRLETQLVPATYPLHTVEIEGLQKGLGLAALPVLPKLVQAIFQTRRLLQQGGFRGVLTTGGYIAAPAILAARSLGLPTILHESNALPGKVTRWLSPWCTQVALGFETAAQYLPKARTIYVGTPVRASFSQSAPLDLPIPATAFLIVVVGGSQGALAVNRLVRQSAPRWLEAGAWIVHLTGQNDPDWESLQHPHYLALPFYDQMAGLLQRANLAISRAGAGTLAELAIAATPAILIPYPYAAEDHQTYNAAAFATAGAAAVFQEAALTPEQLETQVLSWVRSPAPLSQMAAKAQGLAVPDSTDRLVQLVRQCLA